MAKWDLDTIEADMAEIRESVDKLEAINRLQAQTIERQAAEIGILRSANAILHNSHETQAEMLRQAQQSLRNARDSALEEAGKIVDRESIKWLPIDVNRMLTIIASRIRALKSTTQGSRE